MLSLPSTPAAPGGLSLEPAGRLPLGRGHCLAEAAVTSSEVVASAFAVAVGAIALPTAVAYLSAASILWFFSLFGR